MTDIKKKKQIALIVLDGWGYREEKEYNGIAEAKKPFFDELWSKYPHSLLKASGLAVGLPEGQMGNSEVGHTTIGAGQVILTDLLRISQEARENKFDHNDTFKKIFYHVKKNNSTLHLLGLIGSGGVHAHSEHLFEALRSAQRAGVMNVAIHAFTDGRDTSPQSARTYLLDLEGIIKESGVGFISSMMGRYFAMDRDNNWDRLAKAEASIFSGVGLSMGALSASETAKIFYDQGKTDEFFEPVVFLNEKGEKEIIKKDDAVFFLNFRADRARMLAQKVIEYAKDKNILFGTMTRYDDSFNCLVAYEPVSIKTTLAREVSLAGLTQAHIAETEKFAHATYFLNGGQEKPYKNETHILVPSRKDVATHDLAPEMRAEEIAEKALIEIKKGTDFIFINFANPDMVGHTANRDAIIKAIEKVDVELKRVVKEMLAQGGVALITADHGNAEIYFDSKTGKKHTAHTTNPVPFILTDEEKKVSEGTLADIAPTVLRLFSISQPTFMTGKSLF